MYNRINDKVVGLLIRARKKELLDFQVQSPVQWREVSEFGVRILPHIGILVDPNPVLPPFRTTLFLILKGPGGGGGE